MANVMGAEHRRVRVLSDAALAALRVQLRAQLTQSVQALPGE
jgi:hypothetical protein